MTGVAAFTVAHDAAREAFLAQLARFVEAAGAPLALRYQPRLEAARPIPRDGQTNRADLGRQGLGRRAVA